MACVIEKPERSALPISVSAPSSCSSNRARRRARRTTSSRDGAKSIRPPAAAATHARTNTACAEPEIPPMARNERKAETAAATQAISAMRRGGMNRKRFSKARDVRAEYSPP